MIFRRKKKNTQENVAPKGFTLMELLVSIAIFAIISVMMSNIVLQIASFSLDNERRTDFLNDLDGIANTLKNDLRSSTEIGFCSMSGGVQTLFHLNPADARHYILATDSAGAAASSRLIWRHVIYDPVGKACTFSGANGAPIQLSSPDALHVNSFSIARSCEDKIGTGPSAGTCGPTAKNNLLFVLITACDPKNTTVKTKLFDCTNNPYQYEMAISTRIIQ